jgi:hypothetical protein
VDHPPLKGVVGRQALNCATREPAGSGDFAEAVYPAWMPTAYPFRIRLVLALALTGTVLLSAGPLLRGIDDLVSTKQLTSKPSACSHGLDAVDRLGKDLRRGGPR